MDVETNPGRRRPVPDVCRILCTNVQGPAGNLSELAVASSQYDILLCSETLVSDMRHVSEVLAPGFGRPALLCRGTMPLARGMVDTFEMVTVMSFLPFYSNDQVEWSTKRNTGRQLIFTRLLIKTLS